MSGDTLLDVVSGVLLVVGAVLALIAGLGLHRLPTLYARMHPATKPATLGVLCCAVAAGLQLSDTSDTLLLILVVVFQFVTAPVAAHMIARSHRDPDPED
jgi:multicomponent Na+:H+ antiporter subunit G